MSWLLFMDESGHDHKQMPYEVRGGIAVQDCKLWPLIRAVASSEVNCFGVRLAEFKKEFKGSKLFDRDRFKWAEAGPQQSDSARKRNARALLSKGLQKSSPTKEEFTGYGQACLEMAHGLFHLLRDHNAQLFASAIPRGTKPSGTFESQQYLRKDHVYLLERYHHFVCQQQEQGLIVLDQIEEQNDMRFVRQLERYFVRTVKGSQRADHLVPLPLFTSSYLSVPIQVADVCIYCINWGFRRPNWGMDAPTRPEVESNFGGWIRQLQYKSKKSNLAGKSRTMFGITYVPDPYNARQQ